MNFDATIARDLIALSLVSGAGRATVHAALRVAGRHGLPLNALFGLPERELVSLAASGEAPVAACLHACGAVERERAAWLLRLAAEHGMRHLTCLDPDYPMYLLEPLGAQAPPVLFYQGNEALLESRGGGVVGTRRPTAEGRAWARAAARLFAEEGVALISGGAGGVDLEAHEAALRADGTTVVVLPEGLHAHDPHPAIRTGLRNGQVLLLSEFLPTDDWQTHRAMTRNRTIAACSCTVCVVEPRASGGSMYTAEQALAQGKPVFYWGGASRDGALRDRHGARALVRRGTLESDVIVKALRPTTTPKTGQIDFFDG